MKKKYLENDEKISRFFFPPLFFSEILSKGVKKV